MGLQSLPQMAVLSATLVLLGCPTTPARATSGIGVDIAPESTTETDAAGGTGTTEAISTGGTAATSTTTDAPHGTDGTDAGTTNDRSTDDAARGTSGGTESTATSAVPTGTDASTTGSSSESTRGQTSETSDTSNGSDDGSETTGSPTCATLTVGELTTYTDFGYIYNTRTIDDPAVVDHFGVVLLTDNLGVFDLASPTNADQATCRQCIFVWGDRDPDTDTMTEYFQVAGTIDVNRGTDPDNLVAELAGVRLAELDENGALVPGGRCIAVTDGEIRGVPPPAEWTCNWAYYRGLDGCDCGCGAIDPDCASPARASCDYCSLPASCAEDRGCGAINSSNNAICDPE